MRAIQNYHITFKPDAFEFFSNMKNEDALYNVLEYTAIAAAFDYEDKANIESITFIESDIMQVVVNLPFVKNYEATDVFNEISKSCTSLPFCSAVFLTDDNPEQ